MINVGNLDISDISVGDSSVSKIYLGQDLVWEKSSENEVVLNITTLPYKYNWYDSSEDYTYSAYFYIGLQPDEQCTVTFNGEIQVITESQAVTFNTNGEYTGNISFKGNFTSLTMYTRTYNSGNGEFAMDVQKVNSVVKWGKQDFTYQKMFSGHTNTTGLRHPTIDFNVNIPNSINKIGSLFAFCYIDPTKTLSFNTAGEICRFYYQGDNTFSNVTVTNGFHIYNGVAIDARVTTSTPVIPNTITKLSCGLFCNGGPLQIVDGKPFVIAASTLINGINTDLTSISFESGTTITKIPLYFAASNTTLTSVYLPSTITIIDGWAFEYTGLTSITLPNSLTTIGNSAFYNTKLTEINIPNTVTTIGSAAFSGTKLTEVNIPSNVTTVGDNAFYGLQNLSTIKIYSNNISLGSQVFYYKSSRAVNVYTDNADILNYNWSANNVTPTFYHLDGTSW